MRGPFAPLAALWSVGVVAGLVACAPGARPLQGAPTPAVLPVVVLSPRPALWKFTWSYQDETFESRGDGVVRIAPPERARLDFFLGNGMGGGYAILVGDSLLVPGPDLVRRFLPPAPLLWAAIGRLSLPPTADTIARVDGDTLRVDLGTLRGTDASKAQGRAWRLAFAGTVLARAERIEDGRVQEWMTRRRTAAGHWELLYVHERPPRRLSISVTDTSIVEGFDDAIWRRQ
jgi:hypothetical protein